MFCLLQVWHRRVAQNRNDLQPALIWFDQDAPTGDEDDDDDKSTHTALHAST